jgi:methyl-accepting chemotaxis protein
LNNSGKSVSNSIIAIQQQMGELTANAEEANASSEEVAASVKSVADSSFNVSENAEKCKFGVDQVLKAMEELNTTVNQVAIKSEHVSKLTTEAEGYSREGITLADIAEKGMEGITQSTIESKNNMVDITHQMEEIGKIVGLIRDISDQTSLLALNAAIEAARAGEAGLGFAVVADEVKALAQETQVSAENIASIIENLQKRSILASTAMEKTVKDVESGGKALQDTFQSFTRIVELIAEINLNVTDVAATTEEQAASVEEITASITEIGGLVSSTSKEAELSAHSTNEVSVAVNQISQVIGNLNNIVENVQIQINFFKV